MLHQASGRRHRHVGRECRHDQQIDVGGRHLGTGQTTPRGRQGHVAGGQFGRKNAPLANASPLQDPLGVETKRGQLFVVDHLIRDITAGGQDLHPHQPADRSATDDGGVSQRRGIACCSVVPPGRSIAIGRLFSHAHFPETTKKGLIC